MWEKKSLFFIYFEIPSIHYCRYSQFLRQAQQLSIIRGDIVFESIFNERFIIQFAANSDHLDYSIEAFDRNNDVSCCEKARFHLLLQPQPLNISRRLLPYICRFKFLRLKHLTVDTRIISELVAVSKRIKHNKKT